jgi:hypothetical protein
MFVHMQLTVPVLLTGVILHLQPQQPLLLLQQLQLPQLLNLRRFPVVISHPMVAEPSLPAAFVGQQHQTQQQPDRKRQMEQLLAVLSAI